MTKVHPGHEEILRRAVRAPSAHNAQPWRLAPLPGGSSYQFIYAAEDKLLADPDDRDALLAMGAFYEGMALAANLEGMRCEFEPSFEAVSIGTAMGTVTLAPLPDGASPDPLCRSLGGRMTNRHPYRPVPLPRGLEKALGQLGCTLLEPRLVAPLVSRASVMAWKDPRFVSDLKEWTRFNDQSPDGLTCAALNLNQTDRLALRFALNRGSLPGWLAWVYAQRDVRLTRASSKVAVLSVEERTPSLLFDCGRRLLRAWVTISAARHAYHPISIVIDQATAPQLTAMAGVKDAVAIFRVGYTEAPAVVSNRRDLSRILTSPA